MLKTEILFLYLHVILPIIAPNMLTALIGLIILYEIGKLEQPANKRIEHTIMEVYE